LSKLNHANIHGRNLFLDSEGSVLVTTAVLMVVLLGVVGFLVDTGFLYLHKRQAQTAADAAAAGAALQLANGASGSIAISEGKYDSALNGFTNGSNGVTVTINIPPSEGNYTSDSDAVEAIVQQASSLTIMKLLGFSTGTVSARSVARVGSSTSCIYALAPSASSAVNISNGASVTTSCGVYINSSSSSALNVTGGACLTATYIKIVGNYSDTGGACTMSPAPKTSQPVTSNPLSYLTAPSYSSTCTATNYTLTSGNTATISPGTYCNGINVSGGAKLYLNPGLYVLLGGGLTVGGGGTITSNAGGVTFYSTANSTHNFGTLNISNGGTANLAAPANTSNGGTTGILYWENSSYDTNANDSFSGGSTSVLTGALYLPGANLSFSGGASGSGDWTVLVVYTLTASGGIKVGNDFTNYPSGSPALGTTMVLSE
jgi:Flp pilus assembly protein TadG